MPLTRKEFLDIAGPGALGAFAWSTLGPAAHVEAREKDDSQPSPEAKPAERFAYMASAVALGGQIEKPYADVLDSQAATALPPMGGRGVAKVENYRYGQVERGSYAHIVSMDSAHSEVFGGRNEFGEVVTLTTVTVTGLNIGNRVTADRIVARLTSVRMPGTNEPPFYHRESTIERLIIDKQVVPLEPEGDLHKCPTFAMAATYYQKARPDILKRARYVHTPLKDGEAYPDVILLGSVFKQPPGFLRCPDALPGQCCIQADKWSIILGELEITPESRRLTMVRVKMVPNLGGTLEAASVMGDGRIP